MSDYANEGCAVCGNDDVDVAHWDSATGTVLVAWTCCNEHCDIVDGLRRNGILTPQAIAEYQRKVER